MDYKPDQKNVNPGHLSEERLWDVHEVATFLGLAPGTIYHLASQRRIPVIRLSAGCLNFDDLPFWNGLGVNQLKECKHESPN
jgi:hypothetical protein